MGIVSRRELDCRSRGSWFNSGCPLFLTFLEIFQEVIDFKMLIPKKIQVKNRGHPELNQGPLDLQSNALPLSFEHCRSKKLYKLILVNFMRR